MKQRRRSRSPHAPSKPIDFTLLPADFVTKLCLLWVKSYTPLHRLSLNITREVCSYLSYVQSFVAVVDTAVCVLNLDTWRWERVEGEGVKLRLYSGAMVNVSRKQVFITGRMNPYSRMIPRVVLVDSQIQELPRMPTDRTGHMIIYSERKIGAYAFGGCSENAQPLSTAEMYDFRAEEWRKLPSMVRIKGSVCVCLDANYIYIFKYGGRDCERYGLLSKTYTQLSLEIPAPDFYVVSPFIYDKKICVLQNYCYQWDPESGRVSRNHMTGGNFGALKGVVVRGNWAYLRFSAWDEESDLQRFDLSSGRIERLITV